MALILALVGCNNSAPSRKNTVEKAAKTSGERAAAREEELAAKAPQEPQKAIEQPQEARQQPQEAQDKLGKDATGLPDLDERLRKAFDEWVHAKNDADRTAAEARLTALEKEKHKIEVRARACAVNPYEC